MGYRILYEPERNKKYPPKQEKKKGTRLLYAAVLLLLIVMLASNPKVNKVLKHFLVPGNPVQTEQAVAELVNNLRSGTVFREAVTVFCVEILDGAKSGC